MRGWESLPGALVGCTRGLPGLAGRTRASVRTTGTLRRQQAAETAGERIIAAGWRRAAGRRPSGSWKALTIRSVAAGAGVNERTVYRHFTNERGLRDAVMHRMEQHAGIDLDGMQLDDVAGVAARIFRHVSSYPPSSKPPLDPTLTEANLRQRGALHDAVEGWTSDWTPTESASVAALLDVLWSVASYERLAVDWQMSSDQAIDTLTWAIGLVAEAVRAGRRPAPEPSASR